jgi:uncharacterized membrane protein YbhN (UPF0104 family)
MPAQTAMSVDVAALDPIAALRRAGAERGSSQVRRLLLVAGVLAAGVAVAVAAPRVLHVFTDALVRAVHADPAWVTAGVAFELASFAGYIALFWHVAGRANTRIGLRESSQVALAGTAATRLLPTAGAGGAALTWWSLRRAGQDSRAATGTLLSFLVVLYAVFLVAILAAGTLLATGAASAHVPTELSLAPAAAAGAAIALALALARRHRGGSTPREDIGRAGAAGHALGSAVATSFALLRRPHPRLLGAVAWWGFDLMVLWATFNAFGSPPAPVVLVLGYFLGQVANTLPLPGAASGGMVAAFLALGMPAEVVLPAVLAYRAIAIWTPVPAGAVALAGLRRTVRRWAAEDAGEQPVADQVPAATPPRTRRHTSLRLPRLPRPALAGLSPALMHGGQRAPPRCSSYPWISQPSAARAASMTASANAGWGWMERATSG